MIIDGTNGLIQQYDYQTPTTGFSYTFAAGTTVLVMNPAGGLATGTITMPAAPADGMAITFSSSQTITALTVNANTGQSIIRAPKLFGAGSAVTYVYRLANTTWYPMTNYAAAGAVLQVVQTVKTDTFSGASATNVDVTGLSVTITPSSTSSKVLVFVDSNGAPSAGSQIINFQLVRGATNIGNPSSTGLLYSSTVSAYQTTADQTANYSISFLDSPSTTSATTYKIQGRTAGASTWYVNRRNTADMNTISTITAMEIAA